MTSQGSPFTPFPYTQQSGQCGSRGDVIHFSSKYFTEYNTSFSEEGDPGKVFVREWAKYRYGVFDEIGFPGDTQYPNFFYTRDGKIKPTSAVNSVLTGSWASSDGGDICASSDGDTICLFRREGENNDVSCGLGSITEIKSVSKCCSTPSSV